MDGGLLGMWGVVRLFGRNLAVNSLGKWFLDRGFILAAAPAAIAWVPLVLVLFAFLLSTILVLLGGALIVVGILPFGFLLAALSLWLEISIEPVPPGKSPIISVAPWKDARWQKRLFTHSEEPRGF